jgi:hypothetical protein
VTYKVLGGHCKMQIRNFIFGHIAIEREAATGLKGHKEKSCQIARIYRFYRLVLWLGKIAPGPKKNCVSAHLLYGIRKAKLRNRH